MLLFFFFNDTATTEIYTLSLHDALPISGDGDPDARRVPRGRRRRGRTAAVPDRPAPVPGHAGAGPSDARARPGAGAECRGRRGAVRGAGEAGLRDEVGLRSETGRRPSAPGRRPRG